MDSRAYLQRQGWRGDGHSLDHTGNGIKKPLLVSKKVDVLGVGLNKHAAVSDQWWLRAYDQGLRDLGTGKEGALANVQKHGVNRGGLYGRFVRGEGVPGTFGEESASTGDEMALGMPAEEKASRKRKREEKVEKKSARRKTVQEPDRSVAGGPGVQQQPTEDNNIISPKTGHRHAEDIDRQANEYVLEAQRRGIIPTSEDNTRPWPASSRLSRSAGFDETMARLAADAGLTGKPDTEADKYKREKIKRNFKRAARAYLMGESTPVAKKVKKAKSVRQASTTGEAAVGKVDTTAGAAEPPTLKKSKVTREVRQPVKKPRKLSPEKLAEYTKRAGEKGLSLEAYMTRREEKYAAKQAAKVTTSNDAAHISESAVKPGIKAAPVAQGPEVEHPMFVVDTIGATNLRIAPDDPKLSEKAVNAINQGQQFVLVDAAGNETLKWEPDTPIPLDPRIWAGVKANELPKPIRKARKAWMAVRREEKKQRKVAGADSNTKGGAVKDVKSKGQRKLEKREAFVREILVESRKARGKAGSKVCTVSGVSDVQLVKVASKNGAFTKDEITRARTAARAVLRRVKREERAAKGKGKGYKKQERAAKEVARLAQGLA